MADIEGMTVVYSGGPVASNNGRVGVVLGTVRNGWVDVQFDGDAASTKCAPDFLHPIRNSPVRVAAPQMLAALKAIRDDMERLGIHRYYNATRGEGIGGAFRDVQDAIAKAEGRADG